MNLRVRENPWRLMLAVNVAVADRGFSLQDHAAALRPLHPSSGRLSFRLYQARADRRDRWRCSSRRCRCGWCSRSAARSGWSRSALFVELFRRTFGFDDAQHAAVRVHGGLAVLPEEFHATRSGISTSMAARSRLACCWCRRVPLRSCCCAALFSMILILIHHIHLLMYVPTIAVIVVLRYYLVQGFTRHNALIGHRPRSLVGALFLAAQFWGTMAVPRGGFRRLSAKPDGRSHPNRSPELQLHLVSAALKGNLTIPGTHARRTCWAFPCSRC